MARDRIDRAVVAEHLVEAVTFVHRAIRCSPPVVLVRRSIVENRKFIRAAVG